MRKKDIKKKVMLVFPSAIILLGLMLFLPAGSLDYWQGYAFMAVLFIPMIYVLFYFIRHDPKFLERRMDLNEKEAEQRSILKIGSLMLFIGFLVPGLDHRYGWSDVPTWFVITADALIFLSYMLIFRVFKENRYAARTVGVEKGQKIVTTGPYSIVRHPMYAGVIMMYASIPFALGSYWALIFFLPTAAMIIPRTLNEEKVLLRDLKGYKQYIKKVKYRLIPGIW